MISARFRAPRATGRTYVPALRERLINRRQQGDLGEASAIEWLTRRGATVCAPLGHSPDYDLIAELDGRLFRVQVKTTTFQITTPNGHQRWCASVWPPTAATRAGPASRSGSAPRRSTCCSSSLATAGGGSSRPLRSRRDADPTRRPQVLGVRDRPRQSDRDRRLRQSAPPLESETPAGEYPKRSKGGGCKPSAQPSQCSNPPPPSPHERRSHRDRGSSHRSTNGRRQMARR